MKSVGKNTKGQPERPANVVDMKARAINEAVSSPALQALDMLFNVAQNAVLIQQPNGTAIGMTGQDHINLAMGYETIKNALTKG